MIKYGLILSFAFAASVSGQEPEEAPDETEKPPPPSVVQAKVREWVLAQKTLGKEAAEWAEQKRSMADLNELRKKEIAQLDQLIEASGERLTDAEKKKSDLESEEDALRQNRNRMLARVSKLEEQLREQVPMFPPVLHGKVASEIERLENPTEEATLQNRFRDVLVILGAANEFQNSLTVASEVRDFGDQRIEVEVLYLGFSAGWFVDRSGDRAGVGMPGQDGWTWSDDNGAAEKIRRAIALYQRKATPAFIGLPFPKAATQGGGQ